MRIEPDDEAALSEALAAASGPMRIVGGGTRSPGAAGPSAVLSTARLGGITLYEPGSLTLVAGAGTPLAAVETALAGEGQCLPFEPMDARGLLGSSGNSTIGGVVAANVSGPRRVQAGACRDFLLGVRFVDGRGRVIRNGGRVMKNVTGYDLVKLMAGSHGTLGVLTEVALKVLPAAAANATLRLRDLDDTAAIRALSRALGSPFDVSGAAHLPAGTKGRPETLIRIEGFADSVAYRGRRLAGLLGDFGAVEIETDPAATATAWAGIRDVAAFHGRAGDVWRLSVKPSDGPEAVRRLAPDGAVYDWGGGRVWALVPAGTDARARIGDLPGHATLVRAASETCARLGVFPPEPAPVAALAAGLRARFDPRGILNPGLMDPAGELA